jgi:hypothetical protein
MMSAKVPFPASHQGGQIGNARQSEATIRDTAATIASQTGLTLPAVDSIFPAVLIIGGVV